MKRHPHLQPLSDDHHAALVLARRMRRVAAEIADPAELAKTWEGARASFARELEPHFRVEEDWLFPPLEAAGENALVERAIEDHGRLRELIGAAPEPRRRSPSARSCTATCASRSESCFRARRAF